MHDFLIIGGGIIGMSTAMQLLERYPDLKVLLVEKETGPGAAPDRAQFRGDPRRGVLHAG